MGVVVWKGAATETTATEREDETNRETASSFLPYPGARESERSEEKRVKCTGGGRSGELCMALRLCHSMCCAHRQDCVIKCVYIFRTTPTALCKSKQCQADVVNEIKEEANMKNIIINITHEIPQLYQNSKSKKDK